MIRKTSNAIRRGLAVALLSALLVAAIAPVAAGAQATSPTCEQYSPATGTFGGGGSGNGNTNCQEISNNGGGGGGLNSRIGSLPFTGFDVLSMAAVALAVTGLGLVLQRAVSKPREEL
jgi:hypothetical protein